MHQRNVFTNNLIVLEVKKPEGNISYDKLKLCAFRKEFRYIHAGHVILGAGSDGTIVRDLLWIDD